MNKTLIFESSDIAGKLKREVHRTRTFPIHTHLYIELLIYEPFPGEITVNKEKFTIDEATLLLIPPMNFHSVNAVQDNVSPRIKYAFTNDMISRYFDDKLKAPLILKGYKRDSFVSGLVEKIERPEMEQEYPKIILNTLLAELIEKATPIQSTEEMQINNYVIGAVKQINERFKENITLTSVARDLAVTPQYLSAIFSASLSLGFSEYLSDTRLRYAHKLLFTTNMNITEVCYASGYRNLSHFIRSFKGKYGVSPKSAVGAKG